MEMLQIPPPPPPPPPQIKHIVISGGVIYGYCFYGALKHLNQQHVWQIDNITSIHGTSAGALVATIISLKYDWQMLDDYFIKRPWHKIFNVNLNTIMNSYNNIGIFDINVIKEMFLPLFTAKNIPINITMQEYYNITNIELHFFSIEIETFSLTDISHKTHPDWGVMEAIYASCCAPILFSPFVKNGHIYTDGGILCNFPINQCLNSGFDENETLGIHKHNIFSNHLDVHNLSTYHYISSLLFNLIKTKNEKTKTIKNIVNVKDIEIQNYDFFSVVKSEKKREELIENGVESAKLFLDTLTPP